jgi:hypothetical protein
MIDICALHCLSGSLAVLSDVIVLIDDEFSTRGMMYVHDGE